MAPVKSKAQLRRLGELVKEGKMSQDKFDQWLSETPDIKKLPERLSEKKQLRSIDDLKKIAKAKVIK